MPKKRHRITDEEIGEMLRLKREGKTDTAIAKRFGIHRQTVGRYLKRRRNDALADEARKQVLIEELRGHFQQLVNFADNLKWRFGASPSEGQWVRDPVRGALTPNRALVGMAGSTFLAGDIGIPGTGSACWVGAEWKRMYLTSPTDEHFIQALRGHTKGSSLWLQWDRWQEEVADYATASRSLFSWVKDEVETKLQQNIAEYLEPIEEWIMGDILRETNRLTGEELEIKEADLVTPEDRLLARVGSNGDARSLKEELVRIREQARQLPEWTEVQRTGPKLKGRQQELRHIVAEIGSALDGIKLMGAFRGRCHLCPV